MLQKQETCLSWRSLTWTWDSTRVAEASSLPCTEKTRAGEIVFQPWAGSGDGNTHLHICVKLREAVFFIGLLDIKA